MFGETTIYYNMAYFGNVFVDQDFFCSISCQFIYLSNIAKYNTLSTTRLTFTKTTI